jgi:hypothetical protein
MFSRLDEQTILLELEDYERNVLIDLFNQLNELIDAPKQNSDPLAFLSTALGEVPEPQDPALARLFPSAYTDDEQSAADFRKFTQAELQTTKSAKITAALTSINESQPEYTIDLPTALAWLSALNDVRLVFATRIGVDEDFDHESEEPGAMIYGWLTWLQGDLLDALN